MACNSYYDMLPALLALDARLQFIGRDGAVTVTEGYRPNLPNGLLCSIDIPYVEERRFLIDRSYKPIVVCAVSVNRKDEVLVGRAALGCAHSYSAALNTGPAMDWADLAIRAGVASAFGAALAEPISDAAVNFFSYRSAISAGSAQACSDSNGARRRLGMTEDRLTLTVTVNGACFQTDVPTSRILADLIRDELGLTGTRIGCDQGMCGACTVLVDGMPTASCATFAWQVDGKAVVTIEGLALDGEPTQSRSL